MTFTLWYIIIGLLLLGMSLSGGLLKRLPLTTSMLYLGLIGWFGIRGIGSVYYLMYAITHGLPQDQARMLTGLTLSLIATSIVVHGLSVTPLMKLYRRVRPGARQSLDPTPTG